MKIPPLPTRPALLLRVLLAWIPLATTACGPGETAPESFVDACLGSSNIPPELCDCMAARAAVELSEAQRAFLVATLARDGDAELAARSQLDAAELTSAAVFLTAAPTACAGGAPPGA